jgi:hypothetical protein
MKISVSLLLVIIMFVITIVYTYNNDTSMFLFILLLITVFFYVYELVEYKIEAITEPIHRIEKIYANIINKFVNTGSNLENIIGDVTSNFTSKVKTGAENLIKKIDTNFTGLTNKTGDPSANINVPNEFSELINDIKYSRY